MKIRLFIWTLIMVYGLLPIQMEALWLEAGPEDLVISGQGCGCPCPNAYIRKGSLEIPDKILHEHPNIYKNQLTLIGNTPFDPFVYEIAISDLWIRGEITGVDTVLCSPKGCEFAAEFTVKDWTLLTYQPKYIAWSDSLQMMYRIIFYLGILSIFLWFLTRYTTPTMWMRILGIDK